MALQTPPLPSPLPRGERGLTRGAKSRGNIRGWGPRATTHDLRTTNDDFIPLYAHASSQWHNCERLRYARSMNWESVAEGAALLLGPIAIWVWRMALIKRLDAEQGHE